MAILALVLTFAWIALIVGVPTYLQIRRTGKVDAVARGRRGSPAWFAQWISAIGVVFAFAAPVAGLAGLPPIAPLDQAAVRAFGVVLVILGIAVTLMSQLAMGASWRADVDPEARTDLVTTGPFRFVRNPIFTGTATTAIGLALMVPNVLAVAMLIAFLTAWEIQVRLVEEPYLRSVHGDAYRRYAARTGRFVPGIGRLR
jgi:protein-S-isoprenylcysteine O-methyltransferase Ste14